MRRYARLPHYKMSDVANAFRGRMKRFTVGVPLWSGLVGVMPPLAEGITMIGPYPGGTVFFGGNSPESDSTA